MKALLLFAVVLSLAGGASAAIHTPSPKQASPRAEAARVIGAWRETIKTAAAADAAERFHNLAPATLSARLHAAAARYHFTIVSTTILRPRQAAPLIVVRTNDKHELVAATPTILHAIDPKARTNDDRTGWAYEGFLFEALGSDAAPFLVVFNSWRGPHAGGGQWAASTNLYPFAHG